MPVTPTSRYIQLTPWALLEYEYLGQQIPLANAQAWRIQNDYTGTYQFVNANTAVNLTANVLDRSSVPLNTLANRWAYMDIDTIVPTLNIDPQLTLVDITPALTSPYLEYDRIRIHLVSGYNLEGLDGIIARVQFDDRSGKRFDVANHTFRKGESQIEFNSSPIFLGDRLYDRYLEFKIPSLAWAISEFNTNPANPGNFAYQYTLTNLGFKPDSLIQFTLYEIDSTEEVNGNLFFITGNKYEVSFLPADQFGLLGAVIRESSAGDYFEYFATWDGGFPDNYIMNLNNVGGNWAVIHQIEVYEQVGTEHLRTANFTMLQENAFDKPNLYRPVIINANLAFSFSIDYTMRFFNRNDGQQIIRRASVTSYEPKKYGKEIQKIDVQQGYRPVKVYNKIINLEVDQKNFVNNFQDNVSGFFKTITQTKYIPTFYNQLEISVSTQGSGPQEFNNRIFEQGKAVIFLHEFDNRIRFKIYDRNSTNTQLQVLSLSSDAEILLSFITDQGQKIYIQSHPTTTNPSTGEFEFIVTHEIAEKLLKQNDRRFFLISRGSSDSNETVLYQGKYANFSERDTIILEDYLQREKELQAKIKELQILERKLIQQQELLNQQIAQQEILLKQDQLLKNSVSQLEKKSSFKDYEDQKRLKIRQDAEMIDKAVADQLRFIREASQKAKKFSIREIPGKTLDLSASLNAITPKVIKPSDPQTNLEKETKNFKKNKRKNDSKF